ARRDGRRRGREARGGGRARPQPRERRRASGARRGRLAMIDLVCPSCRGPLTWGAVEATCDAEQLTFPIRDAIPELLLPEARERIARFLGPYLAIRHEERWTDDDRELLAALPYEDRSGRHAWM